MRNEDTLRPMVENEEDNLKQNDIGKGLTNINKDEVIETFTALFKKEVDFHHKVAYRFEKAYRLGKRGE